MSERMVKFIANQIWLWRVKHSIGGTAEGDYELAEDYCRDHLRHSDYSFDIFLREHYSKGVKI